MAVWQLCETRGEALVVIVHIETRRAGQYLGSHDSTFVCQFVVELLMVRNQLDSATSAIPVTTGHGSCRDKLPIIQMTGTGLTIFRHRINYGRSGGIGSS